MGGHISGNLNSLGIGHVWVTEMVFVPKGSLDKSLMGKVWMVKSVFAFCTSDLGRVHFFSCGHADSGSQGGIFVFGIQRAFCDLGFGFGAEWVEILAVVVS